MEAEAMRQQQFPFYNEIQAIFNTRVQTMMWIEAEAEGTSSRKKKHPLMSSDDDEAQEDSEGDKGGGRRRKKGKMAKIMAIGGGGSGGGIINFVMKELMGQQVQMEVQWREAYEARVEERRRVEVEWRQRMEALEEERAEMERRGREREEQRWLREEARAEKRDGLITALLNKLITRQNPNI